jgi:crotonobetainyl-CoA:carnitine CoA-transferase CaiB-like acyl-CoA transferase
VKVIGRPELNDDARFRTNGDRMRNLPALTPLIAERLKSRPSADWIREFEAAGVPVGPVNKIGDMLADPQVAAREMVVEVDHPKAGRTKALGHPVKFSQTPGKVTRAAPLLGQHTREVMAELGYTAAEVDRPVRRRRDRVGQQEARAPRCNHYRARRSSWACASPSPRSSASSSPARHSCCWP